MTNPEPIATKQFKSLWKLGGLTPWQLARNVFDDISANNFLGRASELAFDFLFALFPLILLMLALFGLFSSRSVELQSHLLFFFAAFLPPAAFQMLRASASELAANPRGGKLTFDLVCALWFASGGVNSMISALNVAYRVREARSWLKVRTLALGLMLLISILLLAALFFVLESSHLVEWLATDFRFGPMIVLLLKAIRWPVAIVFVTMSYSVIYYCGPNLTERRWHWITPGSAIGATLWLLTSAGFRIYLIFFNSYSALYGSIGAIMILLVWLYVTGLAFLIGGEINAEIERAAAREHSEPKSQ